jgi:hypothetical protein
MSWRSFGLILPLLFSARDTVEGETLSFLAISVSLTIVESSVPFTEICFEASEIL